MTGPEIAALRKALGLSQIELAAKLGMHPASICRWESGKQRPTRRVLKQLQRLERRTK